MPYQTAINKISQLPGVEHSTMMKTPMNTRRLSWFLLMLLCCELITACTTINPEKAAALELISKNDMAYYDLAPELKKDKDIALAAIKKDPHNLDYVDDSLKRDKDVVLAGVSKVGILIVNIGPDNPLYNDPEVVLTAAKDSYPGAVSMASAALKNNPEFVKQAVAVDPLTLCFVNQRFWRDITLWVQLHEKYPNEHCNYKK